MISDSTATALLPSATDCANKNFSKKRRTNRSAKLKQCKFDARREQWLSQVSAKSKSGGDDLQESPIPARKEIKRSFEKLQLVRPKVEENGGSVFHDSDLESLSNSPTSFNSSVLGGNDSGTNFIDTSISSGSSSSSSRRCYSGNVTEEEECDDDDGCLDDWEAMADALDANEKHENQCSESPSHQPVSQMVSSGQSVSGFGSWKCENVRRVPRPNGGEGNCRAWRPDDTFRPESLPHLSKQYSLRIPERRFGGGVPWACKPAMVNPTSTSCPICYEDLDLTDLSFLPCLCGFRLCLFCHKRILEEDGRCPGCRKQYEQRRDETEASVRGGSLMFRLARSCSMIERS